MPVRLLLLFAALAGGDYLLWTWASDGNSTTVALITGVALAPLLLAILWILLLAAARSLLSRSRRHLDALSAAGAPRTRTAAAQSGGLAAPGVVAQGTLHARVPVQAGAAGAEQLAASASASASASATVPTPPQPGRIAA